MKNFSACEELTIIYHIITDASLVQWLADKQIERSELDSTLRYQLLEDFGVSAYLLEAECYQQAYPYIPSDNGWNQGR